MGLMDDFLTARQVQEILKVDRITVYRMLNDGRLKGSKIGQQWRFSRRDVDALLNPAPSAGPANLLDAAAEMNFPTHCVQTIQDLFSEVGQTSALVVDLRGRALTEVSHPSAFYTALMESESARQAFADDWASFARAAVEGSRFLTDHAGMHYAAALIHDKGQPVAVFLAGQFYWQPPAAPEQAERERKLASAHGLDAAALANAAASVPVIDSAQHRRVEAWPQAAARAVESILRERVGFIDRLQRIADLTQIG